MDKLQDDQVQMKFFRTGSKEAIGEQNLRKFEEKVEVAAALFVSATEQLRASGFDQ